MTFVRSIKAIHNHMISYLLGLLYLPDPAMADDPLDASYLASVIEAGGYVSRFNIHCKLVASQPNGGQPYCLVPIIMECADGRMPRHPNMEPLLAHEAYLGATLAQGISEATQALRTFDRSCRCPLRGQKLLVHIESQVKDGKVQGAIMVCRPPGTSPE